MPVDRRVGGRGGMIWLSFGCDRATCKGYVLICVFMDGQCGCIREGRGSTVI